MKLLFVCKKIDLYLKRRLDQLTAEGFEAHCLVLPKFTLYKNWEKEELEPDFKLGFLEKNDTLKNVTNLIKYKKLFTMMEKYDSVNIYKASKLCSLHIDNIKKVTKSYFVTVEDEPIEHNRHIKKLFDGAYFLIFNSKTSLETFEKEFGYDEKTLIARDGNHFFSIIDEITNSEIEKFTNYLNISHQKHLIYCDLGTDSKVQKDFIDDILNLSNEQLKNSTFIFDPAASTLIDKEMLIEYLADKSFDYLLPDSLLTDKQKAMLFKISQSTIFLPGSEDYNTIQPSLYVKNHLYRYGEQELNPKYKKVDIFIDIYENFENVQTANTESYQLVDELTQKNRETITRLYHPQISLESYLKILDIL
jgi:hypothetical protein